MSNSTAGGRGERVDELFFVDGAEEPADELGVIRLVNGEFHFRDLIGLFNPRSGSSLLGRSVFKEDGGLVYTTAGDVITKVSQ